MKRNQAKILKSLKTFCDKHSAVEAFHFVIFPFVWTQVFLQILILGRPNIGSFDFYIFLFRERKLCAKLKCDKNFGGGEIPFSGMEHGKNPFLMRRTESQSPIVWLAFTPFHAICVFLYPHESMRKLEVLWCYQEYEERQVAWNGLMKPDNVNLTL